MALEPSVRLTTTTRESEIHPSSLKQGSRIDFREWTDTCAMGRSSLINHNLVRSELASTMSDNIDGDAPTPPIDVPQSQIQNSHYQRHEVVEDSDAPKLLRASKGPVVESATKATFEADGEPSSEGSKPPKLSVRTRPRGRSLLDEITKKRTPSTEESRKDRSAIKNVSSLQETVPEEAVGIPTLSSSDKDTSPPDEELLTPHERMVAEVYASPATYTPMSSSPASAASSWLGKYSLSRAPSVPRRSQRSNTGSIHKSPAAQFLRQYSTSSVTAAAPPPDSEGSDVGDYVLGKELGAGGFSIVREAFLSSDPSEKPTLAVKIVRKRLKGMSETQNEELQNLLDHEIELWRSLQHEGILQLHDLYVTDFATFAFMPLATNGSLFDAVREVRSLGMGSEQVHEYASQIAEAIRYLHEDVRIVHRDIKLENCLLVSDHGINTHNTDYFNPKPRVVLADFGLAQYLHDDVDNKDEMGGHSLIKSAKTAGQDSNAGPAGSLPYAAPETLHPPKGKQPPLSPKFDIWAFGVMLFAMVTGQRPFVHSFEPKLIEMIKAGDWDYELLQERAKDASSKMDETDDEGKAGLTKTRDGKVLKKAHGCNNLVGIPASPTSKDTIGRISSAGIARNEAWARSCNTIIISDGVDPNGLSELVAGCLNTDPEARWDISRILESSWLAR